MSRLAQINKRFLTGQESLENADANDLLAIRQHFGKMVQEGQSPVDWYDGVLKGSSGHLDMVFAGFRNNNSDALSALDSLTRQQNNRQDLPIDFDQPAERSESQVESNQLANSPIGRGSQQSANSQVLASQVNKSTSQVDVAESSAPNIHDPCVACQSQLHISDDHYQVAIQDPVQVRLQQLRKGHDCGYCHQNYHQSSKCQFLKQHICTNCYQKGHFTWQCRGAETREKCYGCRLTGHQFDHCPRSSSNSSYVRATQKIAKFKSYYEGSNLYEMSAPKKFAYRKQSQSVYSSFAEGPQPWDSVSQQHMDIRVFQPPVIPDGENKWHGDGDDEKVSVKELVPTQVLLREAKISSQTQVNQSPRNSQNDRVHEFSWADIEADQRENFDEAYNWNEGSGIVKSEFKIADSSKQPSTFSQPPQKKLQPKQPAKEIQHKTSTLLLSSDQLIAVLQDDRKAILSLQQVYKVTVSCVSYVSYEKDDGDLLWNVTIQGKDEQVDLAYQALTDMYDDDDPWNQSEGQHDEERSKSADKSEGWLLKDQRVDEHWNSGTVVDRQPSGWQQLTLHNQSHNPYNMAHDYCIGYNMGGICDHTPCMKQHSCLLCFQSDHPKIRCSKKSIDIRPCQDYNSTRVKLDFKPFQLSSFGCRNSAVACQYPHVCAYCIHSGHNLFDCYKIQQLCLNPESLLEQLRQYGCVNRAKLHSKVGNIHQTFKDNKGFCASWNFARECRYQNCIYVHRCSRCNSPRHARVQCSIQRALLRPCIDYNRVAIDTIKDQQGLCPNTTDTCKQVHSCAYCFKADHSLVMCEKFDKNRTDEMLRDLITYGTVFKSGRDTAQLSHTTQNHTTGDICHLYNNGSCKESGCRRLHLCEYPIIMCKQLLPSDVPVKLTPKVLQQVNDSHQETALEWKIVPCFGEHRALQHGLSFCASWNNHGFCSIAQPPNGPLDKDDDGYINMAEYYAPCKFIHVCAICKSPAHPATKCDSSIVTEIKTDNHPSSALTAAKMMSGSLVNEKLNNAKGNKYVICHNYNMRLGCRWSDWGCMRAHVCSQCLQVGHKAGHGCGAQPAESETNVGDIRYLQSESERSDPPNQVAIQGSSDVSYHSTFSSLKGYVSSVSSNQGRIYELK